MTRTRKRKSPPPEAVVIGVTHHVLDFGSVVVLGRIDPAHDRLMPGHLSVYDGQPHPEQTIDLSSVQPTSVIDVYGEEKAS